MALEQSSGDGAATSKGAATGKKVGDVVNLTALEETAAPAGKRERLTIDQLLNSRMGAGTLLFLIVAGLALVFFVAFAVFAFVTYPQPDAIEAFMAKAPDDVRLQALKDLRATWLQQTTSLGQMMVFGSLIPVLSTIIGYVLGSRSK